jgi:hypothetical protein
MIPVMTDSSVSTEGDISVSTNLTHNKSLIQKAQRDINELN